MKIRLTNLGNKVFARILILATLMIICYKDIIYSNELKDEAQVKKEKKVIKNQSIRYYLKQVKEVMDLVEKLYLEDANHQEMIDEGINSMLKSLDPYSSYITDEDLEFLISDTKGEFGGIGVKIIYEDGAIKVISPIDDLPAYNAGIEAGDYIVGVNGKLVSNLGMNKSLKEMRGTPGTKLNLLIVKSNDNSTKEVELTRALVDIDPIKYEIEEDEIGNIGYLRISTFNHKTFEKMRDALDKMKKKSQESNKELKGIIMDLRNNPGGVLDAAIDVVEYFVKDGIILTVEGKNNKKENHFINILAEKDTTTPIVLMINHGSASASEIVAGAMQDHKRAIVIGTTSFGKGLVQNFMPLNKRSGLTITTSKYRTPSGRSINGEGIKPDIYIEAQKVEYQDDDKNKNKFFTKESIKSYLKKYNNESELDQQNDNKKKQKLSKKYKEDYQYARSFDLIRGLIIYNDYSKSNKN